ncbi:MAG: hypothetical protein O2960_25600 [Verrucomicrobia bacterium]|jgi:hypothetical protein|nr:hypothetical protein [Verrucomicrobiota bacterium]
MTSDDQRIAIEEVCGWKINPAKHNAKCLDWINQNGNTAHLPPDYLNDLNAMHDARSIIQNNTALRVEYLNQLRRVIGGLVSDFDLINARSDQHAEALLKALDKWK